MVNEARAEANRANARRSTGPKSAPGKARAAQNARRHGLSQDILADPVLAQEVEDLAHRIAREAGRPDLIDLSRRLAIAHMDVQRIRSFRHQRMQAAVAGLADGQGGASARRVPGADELAVALASLSKELKAIERYMRRALSRRKFAVRDFAVAQRQGAGGLQALAATPARPKQRRPWRSKFPRAVGQGLRDLDEFKQEYAAILEDWEVARARKAARRWAASQTNMNEEKVAQPNPEGG
jgi:hypothetical protein